jgi:ferritin-like metal-binding protein YciE
LIWSIVTKGLLTTRVLTDKNAKERFMDKMNSLENPFLYELRDLYHAEKQLVKALPKVAKKASSTELRNGIEEHLRQTEEHVSRLERVFEILGQPVKAQKCRGMEGILDEADETLDIKGTPETLDAAIIASAQKVEHYEIAGYGTVAAWAEMLGRDDIKSLLRQTLDEEMRTDRKLTEIARGWINQRSAERRMAA